MICAPLFKAASSLDVSPERASLVPVSDRVRIMYPFLTKFWMCLSFFLGLLTRWNAASG